MYKLSPLLFLLFILSYPINAQVLPKEGSILNYRFIGFSLPLKEKKNSCSLEIANGNYNDEAIFRKHIVKTLPCKENKIITEVPYWGERYTWRIVYTDKLSKNVYSEWHHFSTGNIPEVDTNHIRLRVTKKAEQYKDAFVFLDNNRVLYDMQGNAIWFLPDKVVKGISPTDLKLSPMGTVTFLLGDEAYETDYDGNVLWEGPNSRSVSGERAEHYHHEFTRLTNGHYMLLGNESAEWDAKRLLLKDSSHFKEVSDNIKKDTGAGLAKSVFATVIEYDEHGEMIWLWKSSDYFIRQGLRYYNQSTNPSWNVMDPHANSFYFDEKNRYVYVSFKNSNQIFKIKYPEGNVINILGETYKTGTKKTDAVLFCSQHGIKKSEKGYLCLFNNNSCNDSAPSVLILEEPSEKEHNLKKIWEYTCTVEDDYPKRAPKGGNVIVLANASLFVSMGGAYSKIFIVDRDKTILWSALPEIWNSNEKKWDVISEYRASIIKNKKDLERLIWNSGR